MGDRAGQVVIEVDGVDEQPRGVSVGCEALPGVRVDGALGDVDVDADPEVAGETGRRFERGVAARERGVHADHPPPSGAQEPLVLGQPALGTIGPVAIGDAVCAHHADADLAARVGDDVERAVDG